MYMTYMLRKEINIMENLTAHAIDLKDGTKCAVVQSRIGTGNPDMERMELKMRLLVASINGHSYNVGCNTIVHQNHNGTNKQGRKLNIFIEKLYKKKLSKYIIISFFFHGKEGEKRNSFWNFDNPFIRQDAYKL